MGNMGACVAKTRNNAPTKRFCIGKANHWREPVITDVSFNVTSYYRCESSKNLTHTQKHQLIVTIVSIFTFFFAYLHFSHFCALAIYHIHLYIYILCPKIPKIIKFKVTPLVIITEDRRQLTRYIIMKFRLRALGGRGWRGWNAMLIGVEKVIFGFN